MSRIIAGRAKGRTLIVPKSGTRPTSDRVRESLFSILSSRIDWDGVRVLDLFAGSGALGLEALSRGAEYAVFVDNAPQAVAVINKNVEALRWEDSAQVVRGDAFIAPGTRTVSGRFSLVFLDPPYDVPSASVTGLVNNLVDLKLLVDGAMVVVERAARSSAVEFETEAFQLLLERTFGDTKVAIVQFSE